MGAIVKLLSVTVCCLAVFDKAAAIVGLDFHYETVDELPRALMLSRDFPSGLTQMTFCVWMHFKAEDNYRDINPVSYASREAGATNEILLEVNFKDNYTGLYINDEKKGIKALPPSNKWVHVCASWENKKGRVDFYFDGQNVGHTEGTKLGHVIGGKGYMVLGQDQDWYDGGYSTSNSVIGKLTQLHFWDRVLTPQEVVAVRNCQLLGNVINWEQTSWRLAGNIAVVPTTAPCFQRRDFTLDPCPTPISHGHSGSVTSSPDETSTRSRGSGESGESNESGKSGESNESGKSGESNESGSSGCSGSSSGTDENPCAGDEEFDLSHCGNQRDPYAHDLVYYDDEDHGYARMEKPVIPKLKDLSFAFWLQPQKGDGVMTPFSYSASTYPNVAIDFDASEGLTNIILGSKEGKITAIPPLGDWTHIFVKWSGSKSGLAELYFNGTCVGKVKHLNRGYVIGKGGKLLLGQKQGRNDDGSEYLDKPSNMLGRITDFHIWDHALTNAQIAAVARCNSALVGNVVNWNAAFWRYQGYVTYESSTLMCYEPIAISLMKYDIPRIEPENEGITNQTKVLQVFRFDPEFLFSRFRFRDVTL